MPPRRGILGHRLQLRRLGYRGDVMVILRSDLGGVVWLLILLLTEAIIRWRILWLLLLICAGLRLR